MQPITKIVNKSLDGSAKPYYDRQKSRCDWYILKKLRTKKLIMFALCWIIRGKISTCNVCACHPLLLNMCDHHCWKLEAISANSVTPCQIVRGTEFLEEICDPLWENRPLWQIGEYHVLAPFDAKFNGDHDGVGTNPYKCSLPDYDLKIVPGSPMSWRAILEKRGIEAEHTLTINVSIYVYVGPCHVWAVCTSYFFCRERRQQWPMSVFNVFQEAF